MSKAGVFACRLVVGVALVSIGGCASILEPYGLRAEIVDAGEEPLSPEELEELRAIVREVATEEHFVELERWKGEGPYDDIFDGYAPLTAWGRPAAGLRVWFVANKERRYARIQVTDMDLAVSKNEWTRRLMDRVLQKLHERLPDRSVKVEGVDLAFRRPWDAPPPEGASQTHQ